MSVAEASHRVTEVVDAARRLDNQELDQVVQQLNRLRAQRHGAAGSPAERSLLDQIQKALDPEVDQRYRALLGKRDALRLTDEEHAELLELTTEVEEFDARRVEAMAELAALRGVSLRDLYEQFGSPLPPYG